MWKKENILLRTIHTPTKIYQLFELYNQNNKTTEQNVDLNNDYYYRRVKARKAKLD